MEKSIDTLTRYGSEFQIKTISCLVTDKPFFDQIADILSVKFYDSEAKKWVIEKTNKYYDKYKKPPSLSYFKSELKEIESDTLQVSIVDEIRKVWKHREDTDLEYVKDEFLEFAKNQNMKMAILSSVDYVKEGNYEKIRHVVDEALNSGTSRDIGHVYKEDIDTRLDESARETVPTGWEVIDDEMDGGLGPGELGVITAPSGAGKSWSLAHLGISAVKAGYNVVHYTLELDENQTGLRYDSILSGYSPTDVKNHKKEIKEAVGSLEGNLSIKYFPTKSASVQTLNAHFERQQAIEGRPDIVLIDYADLLSSVSQENHSDNTYLQMGNIYTQIRKLAGELQIPVWTVSQATRKAINEEVIEADMIADSYKKIMISDIVLSLSRQKSDKMANTARFHFIKNRFGQDGMTFPTLMDTEHGTIEVYDPDAQKGIEIKNKMKKSQGEAEIEVLSEKYNDYKKTKDNSSNGTASVSDLLDNSKNGKHKETGITV